VTANTAKHPNIKFLVLDFASVEGTEHTVHKKSYKKIRNNTFLSQFGNFPVTDGCLFNPNPL